ncbi:antitoxin VapB family protein [Geoglobus acetivorans]|uniref:Antitoxin n=1 Tax=Geoglobus acetivorans TaxID=565033 RepID=A0A0A7GBZ1_GEOAI|nr:hypothetical protein GACE_0495 [Geoglobus acetivorans]
MKTISIRDDVYNKLADMKEGKESFSDVEEEHQHQKGISGL